ncbi:MAG: twin-arginine translocation signal domain-containing protein, partial [Caldilineaceae bacterium]
MSMQLTRRQFLKFCAAGAATIPLMQMAAPLQAAGKPPLNERLLQAAATTANTSLPSNLPLNLPLADIAMGWDGTLWGIDTNGAPQQYDQVTQDWSVYGSD